MNMNNNTTAAPQVTEEMLMLQVLSSRMVNLQQVYSYDSTGISKEVIVDHSLNNNDIFSSNIQI